MNAESRGGEEMNTENAALALDRIEQKFERLRERLVAVEAERDAAQEEV